MLVQLLLLGAVIGSNNLAIALALVALGQENRKASQGTTSALLSACSHSGCIASQAEAAAQQAG